MRITQEVEVDIDIDERDVLDSMDVKDIKDYLEKNKQFTCDATNYHQKVIFSELLYDVEMKLRGIDEISLASRVCDLKNFLEENGE